MPEGQVHGSSGHLALTVTATPYQEVGQGRPGVGGLINAGLPNQVAREGWFGADGLVRCRNFPQFVILRSGLSRLRVRPGRWQ
ncbi:MAG TPA: hypothetical protein VGS19_18190 [Streptosporangiaceae bacterium]|nr:hypothetical protein [Streptosporangiaceae bacterium]